MFKIGDIVKHKDNPHLTYILKRFTDDGDYEFHAIGKDGNEGCTRFTVVKYQDDWELVEQKPKKCMYSNDNYTYEERKILCDGCKEECELRQKPEWSEEDNVKINRIVACLENLNVADNDILLKDVEWLKSLKDRVLPQPKQEWKQENIGDLTDFENAMMHIGNSFFGENSGLDPNDTNTIKEQANILLGLVPKQEWSEEDEKMLNDILTCGERHCYLDAGNIAWLKSLKNRAGCEVNCTTTKEWNEEDKYLCTQIEGILQECWTKNLVHFDLYKKMRNFIKSIKDRYTWKPSEEEIEKAAQEWDFYNS